MRRKRVRGFQTGDLVEADVPAPLKTAGRHVGALAVRASGSFRRTTVAPETRSASSDAMGQSAVIGSSKYTPGEFMSRGS